MKGNLKFFLLFTGILFLFAGCEAFFTFNLYEGMDPVITPNVDDLTTMDTDDALDELKDAFSSDSVLDAIVSDPDKFDELNAFLESIYTDNQYTEQQQVEAGILSADLKLTQSGGDELVNNIFSSLKAFDSSQSEQTGQTPEEVIIDIFNTIIPPEIGQDKDAFKSLIDGLLAANQTYEEISNGLDITQLDDGTVTGGTVMNAAVCGLVSIVYTGIATAGDPIDVLYELYTLPPGSSPTEITGLNADFTAPDISTLGHLTTLAAAAGADLTTLLGGDSAQSMP